MNKKASETTVEELLRIIGLPDKFFDNPNNQKAIEKSRPQIKALFERIEEEQSAKHTEQTSPIEPEILESISGLEKLVNSDGSKGGILRAAVNGDWVRRTMIMMPSIGSINSSVVFAICALLRQNRHIGFINISDTVIQRARNLCVAEFLRTGAEFSLWIDSDVVVPFGDMTPGFFYDRLKVPNAKASPKSISVNIESRLRSHGRSIVGAIYRQRVEGGKLVTAPHIGKQDALMAQIDEGPSDSVIRVDFVATGCAMIRRDVYTDIMEKFPERLGTDGVFDFFGHDCGKGGEDIAFCKLAAEAGHGSYLDLLPRCAHIGNMAFI